MPTLSFLAELKNLAAIRTFVGEAASSLGANPDTAQDIVQAVDEAATNIILHGYAGKPGKIEVGVHCQAKSLIIYLRDEAPAFDPTLVRPPNTSLPLEKRPLGGLGIFLIRKSTDEIYHRLLPGGGNELTLIKYIKP